MSFSVSNTGFEQEPVSRGFGHYLIPDGQSFDDWLSSKKCNALFFAFFFGISLVALPVIISATLPILYSCCLLPIPLLIFFTIAILTVKSLFMLRALCSLSPPTTDLHLDPRDYGCPNVEERCLKSSAIDVISNPPDACKAKLELIKKAEHSIVWSGCYFGGEMFNEALDIIEQKLNHELQEAVIFGSDMFITPSNLAKLEYLQYSFPHRFFYYMHPEIYKRTGLNPLCDEMAPNINHIKALVIDKKETVVGGSGYIDQCTLPHNSSKMPPEGCYFPRQFHDMDFKIQDLTDRGISATLYLKLVELFCYLKYPEQPSIYREWSEKSLSFPEEAAFSGLSSSSKITDTRLYTIGPEQSSHFTEDLIQLIDQAAGQIYICHMYIQPTEEVLLALKRALARGVRLEVLSNFDGPNAPYSHRLFSASNLNTLEKLFESVDPSLWRVRLLQAEAETLHHKVMVIDDTVIFGSLNLSQKSLRKHAADYEIVMRVLSPDLAERTRQALEHSITNVHTLSPEELHRPLLGRLWGMFLDLVTDFR